MEAENCKLAFYGGRDLNTVFRECFFSEGNKICLDDDGEDYDLANLDPNSRLHQYRNFNKIPSDASMRLDSLSPTFSDIFCYESDEDGDKNSNTQTLKLMIEDTFKSIPSIPSLWQPTVFRADKANVSSIDLSDCEDDRLANLDTNSRQYRYKMVEKIPSDAKSMRLYSTSASTKAPSVIKDKIKRNLDLSKKKEIRKRCALKENRGGRKENRNTCKEYAEWAYDCI